MRGDAMLAAVTEAMIALHRRYYQREPITAKSLMLEDDLLACVLGGIYTDVEKTMIELQRSPVVRAMRSEFQNAMESTFVRRVEQLSGRKVLTFMSDTHVGPDLEIELFMLAPAAPHHARLSRETDAVL